MTSRRKAWLTGLALIAAAAVVVAPRAEAPEGTVLLDQGWDQELRELYYYTPQGSRLMPQDWFLALERAGSTAPFADPASLRRFGWVYAKEAAGPLNPDGLPIGFATEQVGEARWLGLTCAACHANEVTYRGTAFRVDGAPAMLDLDSFMTELNAAIQATLLDADKFRRFAARVLGDTPTPEGAARLRAEYAAFASVFAGDATLRHPVNPSGFGRVDALNQIVNAISVKDLGEPANARPVNAPVSYPALWFTPYLDWVQWAPIAASPIARNVGEVLGVFGSAELKGTPPSFRSTALYEELRALENWVEELRAPPWPAAFGAIDHDLAARGRDLFERDCASCHAMPPFAEDELTAAADNIAGRRFVEIARVPIGEVGTDPLYTQSLLSRTSLTGPLAAGLFRDDAGAPRPLVSGGEYFLRTVGAVVTADIEAGGFTIDAVLDLHGQRFYPMKPGETEPRPYETPEDAFGAIKAGPLLGLWATGPYLHNGSVPTVYDLLSPPEERPDVFWVGHREVDPDRLGFVSHRAPGLFRFDTSKPGNGNEGHAYPTTPYRLAERLAVIEYLKDPERFGAATIPQD